MNMDWRARQDRQNLVWDIIIGMYAGINAIIVVIGIYMIVSWLLSL